MEMKQATEDQVAALNAHFEEVVTGANRLNDKIQNTELTTKCLALALARYGSYFVTEGNYFDRNTEQMISDKILLGLFAGIDEAMDALRADAAPDNAPKIIH